MSHTYNTLFLCNYRSAIIGLYVSHYIMHLFHYPTPLALAIKNSGGLALKKLEKINSGVRKPVCHLNLKWFGNFEKQEKAALFLPCLYLNLISNLSQTERWLQFLYTKISKFVKEHTSNDKIHRSGSYKCELQNNHNHEWSFLVYVLSIRTSIFRKLPCKKLLQEDVKNV